MVDVTKKNVLVIGSGADLVGRRLGRLIDSGRWPVVVRVNKPYGAAADAGSRMDVLVTRYAAWVQRYFPGPTLGCPKVFLNEHFGWTREEHLAALNEVQHSAVSAGLCACLWALNRGARSVSVLGFGYNPATGWPAEKRYPDGTPDHNPHYNWQAEARWLENNVTLL